jgi:MmyB-like transcription regulator ligand binding domain
MSSVRSAVRQVLAGHEPYPAVLVDRHWNLMEANSAVGLLTDGAAAELLAAPANVLRLSLHPDGMAPRIVNLGEWRAHLLTRLRRQVTVTDDAELRELYRELRALPCDQPEPVVELPGAGNVMVPLRLRVGEHTLSLISMTAVFGTPLDVTLSEIAIESFYPADADSATVLSQSR